jgi:hypothetical protein
MAMRLQSPSWLSAGLALLLGAAGAAGQGTFQNLDFEAANIPSGTPPTGSLVSITNALPGWSCSFAYLGYEASQRNDVFYDGVSLGGPMISIIDRASGLYGTYHSLQGTYSAFLFGGLSSGDPASVTITQTGLVPNGTTSILMDVYGYPAQRWYGFTVSLGGQTINMVPDQTFPLYTQYEGDVSAFAGQTAQLSITALAPPLGDIDPNGVLLDDIRFLTIPEPSAFALSALGALLISRRVLGRRCQGN